MRGMRGPSSQTAAIAWQKTNMNRAVLRGDELDLATAGFASTTALLATALFDVPAVVIQWDAAGHQSYVHGCIGPACGVELAALAQGFAHGQAADAAMPLVLLDAGEHPYFAAAAKRQPGAAVRFYARVPLPGEEVAGTAAEGGAIHLLDISPRRTFSAGKQALLAGLRMHVGNGIEAVRAYHLRDWLTGFGNRRQFLRDAAAAVNSPQKPDTGVWASIIDASPPEDVSRLVISMGLTRVERAVSLMAQRVAMALPPNLKLYRLGLARFGFICSKDPGSVLRLAESCVQAFSSPMNVDNVLKMNFRTTAGVIPIEADEIPQLMGALYATSHAARMQGQAVSMFDRMVVQRQQRHGLIVNAVPSALAAPGQLRLVYQPRERATDGRWTTVEALLRWNHPSLGVIPPGEFIPLIENTSLMPILTDWVLQQALTQLAQWQRTLPTLKMSINISASDLARGHFDIHVREMMDAHGINGRCVELELTEGAIVRADANVLKIMSSLRDYGVDIAIDDFGAGYSNLTQLSQLSFDVIKIDNALVRAVSNNSRAGMIAQSVVTLAKQLGHRVVAEGVETAELKSLALEWGCDEIQGYHIARPMEVDDMSAALAQQRQEHAGGAPALAVPRRSLRLPSHG
jgi:EAL domain-containing protein (putative c-di-GMP-specific phosphodiesterase class I)